MVCSHNFRNFAALYIEVPTKTNQNMNKSRLYALLLSAAVTVSTQAQSTSASQMEKLDRGLVAVKTASGTFLSWRMLGTDDEDRTRFDIVCDGTVIAENVYKTNYTASGGSDASEYVIVTKVDGQETERSKAVKRCANDYLTIALDRPAKGSNGGTYTPNDCSVGDVDGDGEYEIILKWDPSNSHDNSQKGKTDNVILDCYKLDGQKLWRIDLGPNIRAGAHYTQFMVYDFDGDGYAEMMCKTAPGSKDGAGAYVNQAATDATIKKHENSLQYANSDGHVISGPEYLTVFDGLTGAAKHTTWYLPGRAGTGSKTPSGSNATEGGSELGKVSAFPQGFWGDNTGNRSERYLAGVAYINGPDKPACGIFCRGYYTLAYVWAVSYDGTRLHTEWLHCSPNATQSLVYVSKWADGQAGLEFTIDDDLLKRIPAKTAPANMGGLKSSDSASGIAGSNTMYGNGNHNMSIADVDGDGCDEILWGSAAVNNDGTLLYAVGYGHGDAMHLSDLMPDRPGLELFDVHEEKLQNSKGAWDVHDAATGEVIYKGGPNGTDNGRGLAADISKDYRGFEFWSTDERTPRRADNGSSTTLKNQSVNFRVYWNGDLYDELLDGHYTKDSNDEFDHVDHIYITTGNAERIVDWTNRSNCNTTKMTPNLSGDILGDWREEIVLWDYQNPSELYIHTTTIATDYRMPTLMHDHTYRMGICWQNTAYNQPPHLGYFLPDALLPTIVSTKELTVEAGAAINWSVLWRYAKSAQVSASYLPDGTKKSYALPDGMARSINTAGKTVELTGALAEAGDYKIEVKLTGLGGETATETLTIHVGGEMGIGGVANAAQQATQVYDLQGREHSQLHRGLNIVRRSGRVTKELVK